VPTVLSLVSSSRPEQMAVALDNHRTYCTRFGYTHAWQDVANVPNPDLATMHTLHLAQQALRTLPENDLLMVIDAGSAVYHPQPLDALMEGRDTMLTFERVEPGYEPGPQMNWLVLRNSAAARQKLGIAIFGVHKSAIHDPKYQDSAIFRDLGAINYYSQFAGAHLNIAWQNDKQAWYNAIIFIINSRPPKLHGVDGGWHANPFSDPRLELLVLKQVNAKLHGLPSLQQPAYPALSEDAFTSYNPQSRIALVTLYTHHINVYGRISEHNIKRYCDRHGLAYHVYRAVPEGLDSAVNGTWHKTWLLDRHYGQHDWVIWVDADILFTNQSRSLAPLLEGKDLLLAKDLGDFPFNAGVMGFRCTEKNRAVIAHIQARINAIADKSSVYASGGDQQQCAHALGDLGYLDGTYVMDMLSVNTPPLFRSPSTMMVHYVGLQEPYRSMYMAMDDAQSIAS
jgi:hypothetical protein